VIWPVVTGRWWVYGRASLGTMPSCEVVSTGPADTADLAGRVASELRPGDVVLLTGGLAAGKTTFVTAVAAALGYDGPVTSPTFTLANFYPAPALTVLHVDTYRLGSAGDFIDLGLADFMDDAATLIEWGDLVSGEFECVLRLELEANDPEHPDHRAIRVSSGCDRWAPVIEGLDKEPAR
jgi:tRNA threonylcarbamoyladenosine biosynthesis protein TsaE